MKIDRFWRPAIGLAALTGVVLAWGPAPAYGKAKLSDKEIKEAILNTPLPNYGFEKTSSLRRSPYLKHSCLEVSFSCPYDEWDRHEVSMERHEVSTHREMLYSIWVDLPGMEFDDVLKLAEFKAGTIQFNMDFTVSIIIANQREQSVG